MKQNGSIKHLLLSNIMILSIIFFIVIFYIIYGVASKVIEKQTVTYAQSAIDLMMKNVDFFVKDINQLSISVMSDPILFDAMRIETFDSSYHKLERDYHVRMRLRELYGASREYRFNIMLLKNDNQAVYSKETVSPDRKSVVLGKSVVIGGGRMV